MDINEILKAVENDKISHILNLTTNKNHETKVNILKELQLTKSELIQFMKKLRNYRYIDQMDELKQGGYIKWIDIRTPENIELTNSVIFCDFKINDNGVSIIYKNFYRNKRYEFKMEEAIIFQKLTEQEEILLKIMDKLNQ